MIIPISVDASQLASNFSLKPPQVDNLMSTIVQSLGLAAQREWVAAASRHSVIAGITYRNAVVVTQLSFNRVEVSLSSPLANQMESGKQPWDMKPAFQQSSKAKPTKSGGWRFIVPFRFATPTALGASEIFSGKLPLEVYRAVKDNQGFLPQNQVPSPYNVPRTRNLLINRDTQQIFAAYSHKTSIYSQLSRITDPTTGQNRYQTFRAVSNNSQPNSWIHPGFPGNKFSESIIDMIDVETIVGNAIDDFVAQL